MSASSLALYPDKSPAWPGCPTPRIGRAWVGEDGELLPIPCGRNSCLYCRPRNVQITAAMVGLAASRSPHPPTYAVLSTTRDEVDQATLRNGWKDVARRVRREVCPRVDYAWFREWTTGRHDLRGVRRTHYHSIWTRLNGAQAAAVADVSREVWARLAGAWSKQAHGYERIWDAGGLARYVAGLAGHHLKTGQAPPTGWKGRRYGTSRGFYAGDARELRAEAEAVVRDERIAYHLRQELLGAAPDELPRAILDEQLTARLSEARARPKLRVVAVREDFWERARERGRI